MDNVVIYRSFYGQLSETFVRDHVQGLRKFRAMVIANRTDPRGPAETVEMEVIPDNGLLRGQLWRNGWSRRMHTLIRQWRPALIHAHFLTDGASVLPYARAHSIPLIVTAHGYDATTWPEVQQMTLEGRLLLARQTELATYASRILCVSDFIRDQLLARGYPAEKLITQHLGVDTDIICPRSDGIKRGIITVGRLVEKKGTRFLIEAYATLPHAMRAEHPLTVIGDGALRGELETLAASLGVIVNFAGGCPRERVMSELTNTALFCFPSIRAESGDAEGMGIAVMEALALATPVVLFDGQPAAEVLANSHSAAIARGGDAKDLGRVLQECLADPLGTAKMGRRGRTFCEANFNIKTNNAAIEEIYSDICYKSL